MLPPSQACAAYVVPSVAPSVAPSEAEDHYSAGMRAMRLTRAAPLVGALLLVVAFIAITIFKRRGAKPRAPSSPPEAEVVTVIPAAGKSAKADSIDA